MIAPRSKDIYLPYPATILDARSLTPLERFFRFKMEDDRLLNYMPGQFVEISIPGIGECPISITSSPTCAYGGRLKIVIRNAGNVTNAMHGLKPGERVGIRGPFGSWFPVEASMKKKDLLFICGGLGLVPVKSAIDYVLDDRFAYGHITILVGNRQPENRLFMEDLLAWKQRTDITCMETVDTADPSWGGNVGPITLLLPRVRIHSPETVCIICGPPVMYRFVLRAIEPLGLRKENVLMSLERHMKCAVGKCGHCQINGVYGCQRGPVFSYKDILTMGEAI